MIGRDWGESLKRGKRRKGKSVTHERRRWTPPVAAGVTLAQLMTEARIKLEDIGIAFLRPKVAATGAMLLEVPGENSAVKADQLASKLREVLAATGASVNRPVKCEDMRIFGLDESMIGEEVAAAVATAGECDHRGKGR